jgi:hypothetical protein
VPAALSGPPEGDGETKEEVQGEESLNTTKGEEKAVIEEPAPVKEANTKTEPSGNTFPKGPTIQKIGEFKYATKTEFENPYGVKGDGWCLYRALIRGEAIANNKRSGVQPNDHSWTTYELNELKTTVMPEIQTYMRENLDKPISSAIAPGNAITFREAIVAETSKPTPPEINTYVSAYGLARDLNGDIKPEDYINRIGDFSNATVVWGNPQLIVPIFKKLYNINVEQYELIPLARKPDGVPDNFINDNYMKTVIGSDEPDDPSKKTIYLLYNGENHYDLLIHKVVKEAPKKKTLQWRNKAGVEPLENSTSINKINKRLKEVKSKSAVTPQVTPQSIIKK